MLTDHNRLVIKTLENEDIEIEVNYSDDPEIKDCKVFRVSMGEKVFQIKRDELLRLLLALGDPSTQKKLLPTRVKNIKKIERRLHFRFKAKKDYREGETIEVVAPWIDEVITEEEKFSGNINTRKPKLAV